MTVRIGILGTARIAVPALILAATPGGRSGLVGRGDGAPEAAVTAVAARDRSRAEAYAAEHGIPRAYGSYDELLSDPDIDAVYNPLPNSLHAP